MRNLKIISRQDSPLTYVFLLIGIAGAIYYLVYLIQPGNSGDVIPYILVLIAEVFLVFQVAFTFWTMYEGKENTFPSWYYTVKDQILKEDNAFYLSGVPLSVDVFITVYGEDLKVIYHTVKCARDMYGKHTTYILDDGNSAEVKKLAWYLGVEYITRHNKKGAKAGNINNALSQTKGDFFVIFDADHAPEPQFLYETLPFFADPNVAFVQTPQHLVNTESFLSRGTAYAQRLFYGLLCSGKARFNSMFCVGTNVVFRRESVESVIGGIYEGSKSEDIWTAMFLHEAGYSSIYYPYVLAHGEAPDNIRGYVKQQQRWARGAFEIFFHRNPLRNSKLSFEQRLQYLSSATFYFTAVAIFILILIPSFYIFLDWAPLYAEGGVLNWFIHYAAFYIWQIILASFLLNGFKWESMILSVVSFPVYLVALWQGLRNKDEQWAVTGQQRQKRAGSFDFIIPQIICWLFLFLSTTVAINLGIELADKGLYFAIFWNSLNLLIFSIFLILVFKEEVITKS